MSFINRKALDTATDLYKWRYAFERADRLQSAFGSIATEYWGRAATGKHFEARGLMVTGASRVGKTSEIRSMLSKFNEAKEELPSGKVASAVSCILDGKMTWKDLGFRTAEALGYPVRQRRMTQSEIWSRVTFQAKEQGVVAIHFDECQHIFPTKPDQTTRALLDSFKSLMKNTDWPLMLILSGVDELAGHVEQEEQLDRLLRRVRFQNIRLPSDMSELNRVCFTYCDAVGLDFEGLATEEFLRRLAFACADRWGLVIELLIDTCLRARAEGGDCVEIKHFSTAFADRSGMQADYTPFNVPNYESKFIMNKVLLGVV
ncbi:AAA family ATPase [Limimaricola cinnabarinus]|uniref:ORC1/DEAH AAA+ ATPase domain-containing protein n=1 Tax=Limimaricola cinnabarinus TaxID=1125964 RepID=A0A2G1MIZ0_9RHOB|nr:AAA family ATPase [Limimaricola cinnabarinus]PHP28703.1 hypothetical protein CJ301_05760 [Limimaricola cinnabarinus]